MNSIWEKNGMVIYEKDKNEVLKIWRQLIMIGWMP